VSDVKYPDVQVELTGTDGNVFSIIGKVRKEIMRSGWDREAGAKEFTDKAFACGSYDEVLQLVMQTVEVA